MTSAQPAGVTPLLRRGFGYTVPAPVRSDHGIRRREVLDPHHEDDIIPVILEEPDHHGAFTVALHVGHRFCHVEWRAYPAHSYIVAGCLSLLTAAALGLPATGQKIVR